jgi:hypothetical protein
VDLELEMGVHSSSFTQHDVQYGTVWYGTALDCDNNVDIEQTYANYDSYM